jgi:N-methylhydantoinase A
VKPNTHQTEHPQMRAPSSAGFAGATDRSPPPSEVVTAPTSLRIAVDIGGTFTDLAWYDGVSAAVGFGKALSTPRALVEGVQACLAKGRVEPARMLHLIHGSTVAINAVIQKTGARTALVTTEGFGDVYEIGRANRPDTYNLFFEKPVPLVPRTLRLEVRERLSARGEVMAPFDVRSARAAVARLERARVEAVAVCFLHAYANPEHERQMGELVRRELPGVFVTLSHEILREFREYERTSTTVLNAFVGPLVSRYLAELEAPLRQRGFRGTVFMMQSNGGVMTAERARTVPVAMMESGPAGGVIGAAELGKILGYQDVIAFDMGGTTAKACLVERGLPKVADGYYIGGYATGYPLRLPVVDIVEVGTGGGSLAWIDEGGALKVGPRSAGAEPGPVCYRRGGTEPTVTDANLIVGRLDPWCFLGGELDLDADGALRAVEERVAKPFGMTAIEAAHGILTIADARMAFAVRAVTVQRGLDPRDFVLVAFGGAGPLHATAIARELRIPRVIIPPQPGHFSAVGMLMTDVRHDYVQTWVRDFQAIDAAEIEDLLGRLEDEGRATLRAEGLPEESATFVRSMEMRYLGQEYTVTVVVPPRLEGPETLREIRTRFDEAYDVRYGHSAPAEPIQLVNVRVSALGAVPKPAFARLRQEAAAAGDEPTARRVFFGSGGWFDCPVFRREALAPGTAIDGPAIVEEYASTTVLHPGDRAVVEPHGCLVIDIEPIAR